jgi:sterol desaturase/sphingolipid hydroxylase (fatty acid hydroxylase superfamily)
MLTVIILAIAQKCAPEGFRANVAAQPLWLQLPEIILLADFGFYLAHRMFHAVPYLWKFHQVHHSIEELDWLAGARVHPLDQIATKGASLLLTLPFGFSFEALMLSAAIYQFHSTLLHSNVNIKFGPLKWMIASPEFHHWHHANEKEAYDRNFGGQFSFLDLIFGSLYMPQGRTPEKFGINNAMRQNYFAQLAYPFIDVAEAPAVPTLSEQAG